MAAGIRWTRDQLLIVLNLYHKLRFGQFDARQPVIIDLAARLGRTPGSVAMKLNNLASLDPALKLRGVRGLPGASALDRTMWEEFHNNPAELVPLSQERFDALFVEADGETTEVIPGSGIRRIRPPSGETEVTRPTKQRRGQDYFRDIVLNNYGNRCALTGLPIRELLIASHILPWHSHEAERLNVRNGIALNRLHDAAFDQGLIAFDDGLRLILPAPMSADRHGLDQTQRNADWLSGKLTALNGCAVPVAPVLVLPGWWVEAKGKGAVTVLNPKGLRSFLNSRAPTLSAERQRAIAAQMEERCRIDLSLPA